MHSPLKSLQTLSADADLTLAQVSFSVIELPDIVFNVGFCHYFLLKCVAGFPTDRTFSVLGKGYYNLPTV